MKEKIIKAIKKNYQYIILMICAIILSIIMRDLFNKETLKMDMSIYELVVLKMRREWLTNIFKIITNLGGAYFLCAVCILSIFVIKNKKIAYAIPINLILSFVLNFVFKNLIERPRPIGYRLIEESGYSFPSGHSMVNTAFYGLIIYFIWKYVENKKLKYILCALLSSLIFLIGLTRIYLGVHYASDVISGFIISIMHLIVFIKFYNIIIKD